MDEMGRIRAQTKREITDALASNEALDEIDYAAHVQVVMSDTIYSENRREAHKQRQRRLIRSVILDIIDGIEKEERLDTFCFMLEVPYTWICPRCKKDSLCAAINEGYGVTTLACKTCKLNGRDFKILGPRKPTWNMLYNALRQNYTALRRK